METWSRVTVVTVGWSAGAGGLLSSWTPLRSLRSDGADPGGSPHAPNPFLCFA